MRLWFVAHYIGTNPKDKENNVEKKDLTPRQRSGTMSQPLGLGRIKFGIVALRPGPSIISLTQNQL